MVLPTPPFMDVTARIRKAGPFESGIGCGSEPSGDHQQAIGEISELNRTLTFWWGAGVTWPLYGVN